MGALENSSIQKDSGVGVIGFVLAMGRRRDDGLHSGRESRRGSWIQREEWSFLDVCVEFRSLFRICFLLHVVDSRNLLKWVFPRSFKAFFFANILVEALKADFIQKGK